MDVHDKDIFHVHTQRCRHAEDIPDEAYIERALAIGSRGIWFTDHSPFPGNPFRGRMDYDELPEYLGTLKSLKEKYRGLIDVHIGLEIEYFPFYDKDGYYKDLKANPDIELLLLGQHLAETWDGYTFNWDKNKLAAEECIALGEAEIQGIQSGYFDIVAHPDRIFRRRKAWTPDMQEMSEKIIFEAEKAGILLEQNASSMRHKHHYWPEFWRMVKPEMIIQGLDAHFLKDLDN